MLDQAANEVAVVSSELAQFGGTARLHGGTLAYSGTSPNKPTFSLAITGGTGAYEAPRARFTIHNLDPNGNVSDRLALLGRGAGV
ncbi:MAG: hypothetical protein ACJ738_14705 [Gaiellales bacterium]